MQDIVLNLEDVVEKAGYVRNPDGRFSLPNTQECADLLAKTALEMLKIAVWTPGAPIYREMTLTGGLPIWGYLKIAHALHGRCSRLVYASPAATIEIFNHGA